MRLIQTLLEQGGVVHEVLQQFARSLKQFVQSREYMEQRRINRLIMEAQRAALALKDEIKATEKLDFQLRLTSGQIRSLAQWVPFDPSVHTMESGMPPGQAALIDLDSVAALVQQSEIDFRSLTDHILDCLKESSQVSIGVILDRFPAAQGLGSIVGYIALGSRQGLSIKERSEVVTWVGEDCRQRWARIPLIYFLQEQMRGLF